MKTRTLLFSILATMVVSACQTREYDLVNRFEHNINEHSFSQDGTRVTGRTSTIQSRMEHYKTPGLSLSILDDYQLGWQRSYGFLEVGKAATLIVTTPFMCPIAAGVGPSSSM